MAKLFDSHTRVVPTWLAAARHLNQLLPNRTADNLFLEITDPLTITTEDRQLMDKVDCALIRSELTLRTVAGTIFPLALYKQYGRPGFYAKYMEMLARGKQVGTWGTYAARMIDRAGQDSVARINPLEMLVMKLRNQPQKKNGKESSYVSTYELGVAEPNDDLPIEERGAELPTYDPAFDALRWFGGPCLSHLSFKRTPAGTGHAVNLVAIYRSHHYCARALGNLIGLAQLQSFVAKESGLKVGTLSCLSSYAELDVGMWGGVNAVNQVLA